MIAVSIAMFAQGHPISFRTLGAGVKINRFPNTVRWNGLERQQSFDFFFSRLFCANSGKISNSVLMTFFRRQYAGKTDSAPTTMRCRRSLAKRSSTSFQRFFFAKRFSTSFQRFFLLAFFKPITIIPDLPPS